VKGTSRTLNSASGAYRYDSGTNSFNPIEGRLTALSYREQIGALYAVATRPVGKASVQAGLRAEHASTNLDLPRQAQAFGDDYWSLFPSAALTYNLTEVKQLRAAYSRRISRPDAPQLDPAQFNEDSRTAFRGNPYLKPEYTDAIETGYQQSFGWGSLQVNPFLRLSNNAVRQVRTVDADGVTIATFANIANTRTLGTDVNANVRRGKLTLSSGVGAFDYRSEGGVLSTRATAWNARSNMGYAFTQTFDMQFTTNYRAPQKVEGGRQLAFFLTTVGARKKLFGETGSLTLRVTDPLNTARFAIATEDGRVSETQLRRFGQRGVFVTFSRSFGQAIKLRPKDLDQPAAPSPLGTP
jgi:outer membrane receptor protein involved in Fe transport